MASLYGHGRAFVDVVKQQGASIRNDEAVDENGQNSPTLVRRQVPVNRSCDGIVPMIGRQKTPELTLPRIGVTHVHSIWAHAWQIFATVQLVSFYRQIGQEKGLHWSLDGCWQLKCLITCPLKQNQLELLISLTQTFLFLSYAYQLSY